MKQCTRVSLILRGFHRAGEAFRGRYVCTIQASLCLGKRQNGSVFRRSVALAGTPIQKRVYSLLRPRIGEHVQSRAFTYEVIRLKKYALIQNNPLSRAFSVSRSV